MGEYSIPLMAYSIKAETKKHLSVPLTQIYIQENKPALNILKPLNLNDSRYCAAGQKNRSAVTFKNVRQ